MSPNFSKRLRLAAGAAVTAVLSSCGMFAGREVPTTAEAKTMSFYDFETEKLLGGPAPLKEYQGRVSLVVNVASKCGLTPQYEGLQKLYEELEPKGFTVLGFPSNDFGGQEPGTPEEIANFCDSRYAVTFPMFAKVQTKPGEGQSPLYTHLGAATGSLPGWNFGKYLIAKDGRVLAFFDSRTAPTDPALRKAIDDALAG